MTSDFFASGKNDEHPPTAVAAAVGARSRWADSLLLPPCVCLRTKTWTVLYFLQFSLFCVLCPASTGGYHGCVTQGWTGWASSCLSALMMVWCLRTCCCYKLMPWLCHQSMKFWESKPALTGLAVVLWSPMIAGPVGQWLTSLERESKFAVGKVMIRVMPSSKQCFKHCPCREA